MKLFCADQMKLIFGEKKFTSWNLLGQEISRFFWFFFNFQVHVYG